MSKTFDTSFSDRDLRKAMDATFNILRALVLKNDFGWTCARAGWTLEMAFHHGDTLAVRERAWQVVDLFVQAVGADRLVYWWDGMPTSLDSEQGQAKITKDQSLTLENPSGYVMMFNMASGKPKPPEQWEENAQDFRLYCRIHNEEGIWFHDLHTRPGVGPAMSFIRMALPVDWVVNQPAERGAGWFTSRAVELMQPFWCTAGWGIMPAVEERNIGPDGRGQQKLYPYLQRFPGLNAIGSIPLFGTDLNDGMPSVNWLNYLSEPLLERLDGREAVRQQIEASQYLAAGDIGACLGIRAGGFPALGDTERGIGLPAFGEAARLLKPIRVKTYGNNFIGPPPSGSNNEAAWLRACDAYLCRFDNF